MKPVDEEVAANSKGKLASKLGALNAAHASARAFPKASPNSRIGRIREYYEANQASIAAASAAEEAATAAVAANQAVTDAQATVTTAEAELAKAQAAAAADPANAELAAAVEEDQPTSPTHKPQ